jgi:hypothetical protein
MQNGFVPPNSRFFDHSNTSIAIGGGGRMDRGRLKSAPFVALKLYNTHATILSEPARTKNLP